MHSDIFCKNSAKQFIAKYHWFKRYLIKFKYCLKYKFFPIYALILFYQTIPRYINWTITKYIVLFIEITFTLVNPSVSKKINFKITLLEII